MKDDKEASAVTNGEPIEGEPEEEEEEEEVELVDPLQELRDKCAELPGCSALKQKLEECNERVNNAEQTTENCSDELIDFMHCLDVCLSKDLFSKLK